MSTAVQGRARIRLRTHAKLNLFLRVLGRRADGYHELKTIFHGIDLGDDLDVSSDPERLRVEVHLADGVVGEIPAGKDNTAAVAAHRLRERRGIRQGASIGITKRIPIGAGLAGGSANAAGALLALDALWATGLSRAEMLELALSVGSDVPYCLTGGTALATSRGEHLAQLRSPAGMWFVLGISWAPLLTRDVFAACDELGGSRAQASSTDMADALEAGDAAAVASLLHNDLEIGAFALRPELAPKKQRLLEEGALGACTSGSGPTIFGVADSEHDADELARRVAGDFDRVEVVRTHAPCVERLDETG